MARLCDVHCFGVWDAIGNHALRLLLFIASSVLYIIIHFNNIYTSNACVCNVFTLLFLTQQLMLKLVHLGQVE